MKKVKWIITLLLIFTLLCCGIFSGSAYQYVTYPYSAENVKMFSDNSGTFLASSDDTQLYIEEIAPESFLRTLSLPYPVFDFHISTGMASAVCADTLNQQTVIFYYDIERDYLDSFSLSDAGVSTDIGYAMDQNGIYLCDGRSLNVIARYSYSGKREYRYEFSSTVTCICQDYSSNVYAIANNTLYRLDPNGIDALSSDAVYHYISFLSDDVLIDLSGNVFSISSGAAEKLFTVQSAGCFGTVIGDDAYLAAGDTVMRYRLDGGKTGYFTIGSQIVSLFADDDRVAVITGENGLTVNYLYDSDFVLTDNEENSSDENIPVGDSYQGISSDLYRIDFDSNMIYAIPANTTIEQWKDHMNYDGYSLTLYQGNTVRKSGKIATAMTAVFSKDDTLTFELCVIGEITGEGNVNSKDRKALMDYLLGSWNLTGAYLYAADINLDGNIDLLDAVRIYQMTE